MKVKPEFGSVGILLQLCLGARLLAQAPTIPPVVTRVWAPGVKRGSTATLTIEGRNLASARAVLFDVPGLSGKILDVKDLAEEVRAVRPGVDTGAPLPQGKTQEAKVEVTVAQDVATGGHKFRIQTPLGTSNTAVLDIGALPEIPETEPNDVESQKVELPATLVGTLGWPGDVDSYEFTGKAGQEMVFQVEATPLGSEVDSVLALRDSSGRELVRAGEASRSRDALLIHTLPADGKYTIAVSDLEKAGGPKHFYRLNAGPLPYVREVYALGVRAGTSTEVRVRGANLGDAERVTVQAPPSAGGWQTFPLRVKTKWGESLNEVKLAVGDEPEISENEPNDNPSQAQPITIPATVNGRISGATIAGTPDEDYFRFTARKTQHLVLEVAAARLGSELDSVVEVLDAQGHEIPQATVRALAETPLTLSDRDSRTRLFRLTSLTGFQPNDYLLVGDELVQIDFVPDQPDADVRVKGVGSERIAFFNTSREAHPVNGSVYKVQILEPGAKFPPNGLPVMSLTLRNDDGGPGYEADSRLVFVAPQDGEFLLHIKDVRGIQGEHFPYRLTVHDARPDFTLMAQPANPNVPRGGRVPVVVTANRTLGYQGPIGIEVEGLPKGITANLASIPADQDSTTIILEASASVPETQGAMPFKILGKANIDGREVVRWANPEEPLPVVAVMPPPDVQVAAEPHEVVLELGKETTITLHVERKNGFQGRVPCNVLNLPPGVTVVNAGLNGILVPEKETQRTFTLRAESWAKALEQPLYVTAEVESNSPTYHASAPLTLKVRGKEVAATAELPEPAKR